MISIGHLKANNSRLKNITPKEASQINGGAASSVEYQDGILTFEFSNGSASYRYNYKLVDGKFVLVSSSGESPASSSAGRTSRR